METVNRLFTRLRRYTPKSLYDRWQWRRNVDKFTGVMATHSFDPVRISDGAVYNLPISLPGSLKKRLQDSDQLETFLQEAWRQNARFGFDSPFDDSVATPVTMPADDPLREWDHGTRRDVLSSCHSVFQRNPIAKRAVRYVSGFAIGDGFKLQTDNVDVQQVLEDFIDHSDNQIRTYERQVLDDLLVDGEIVLQVQEEGGEIIAVPMRPWELRHIETEKGMFRRVKEYVFDLEVSSGDNAAMPTESKEAKFPPDQIMHIPINNHAYELRGRPEIFPILPWLQAHGANLQNLARIDYWRSALMWLVSVDGNAQAVSSIAAQYNSAPSPGTISVHHAKVDVKPLSASIDARDRAEVARQLKLMAAVGMGLPEYFLADGENANLASANKQELPALTTFAEFQSILVDQLWTPLFKRVIQVAVDAEVLPQQVEVQDADGDKIDGREPIEAIDAFRVKYEPLQQFDINSLAQALNLALMNALVDTETASTEMGFDYQIVKKKLAQEREQEQDEIAQGLRQPPPFMRPEAMNGRGEEEEDDRVPDTA